jgi:hypothetical protein
MLGDTLEHVPVIVIVEMPAGVPCVAGGVTLAPPPQEAQTDASNVTAATPNLQCWSGATRIFKHKPRIARQAMHTANAGHPGGKVLSTTKTAAEGRPVV